MLGCGASSPRPARGQLRLQGLGFKVKGLLVEGLGLLAPPWLLGGQELNQKSKPDPNTRLTPLSPAGRTPQYHELTPALS